MALPLSRFSLSIENCWASSWPWPRLARSGMAFSCLCSSSAAARSSSFAAMWQEVLGMYEGSVLYLLQGRLLPGWGGRPGAADDDLCGETAQGSERQLPRRGTCKTRYREDTGITFYAFKACNTLLFDLRPGSKSKKSNSSKHTSFCSVQTCPRHHKDHTPVSQWTHLLPLLPAAPTHTLVCWSQHARHRLEHRSLPCSLTHTLLQTPRAASATQPRLRHPRP